MLPHPTDLSRWGARTGPKAYLKPSGRLLKKAGRHQDDSRTRCLLSAALALYPRLLGRPALNVQIGVFGLLIVRSRCSCIGSPQCTPCTPTRPHLDFGHLFRVNLSGPFARSAVWFFGLFNLPTRTHIR